MLKLIEVCRKTVFVLSQLTCMNTYIKYITEKSHMKTDNYVKSTLDFIVSSIVRHYLYIVARRGGEGGGQRSRVEGKFKWRPLADRSWTSDVPLHAGHELVLSKFMRLIF